MGVTSGGNGDFKGGIITKSALFFGPSVQKSNVRSWVV